MKKAGWLFALVAGSTLAVGSLALALEATGKIEQYGLWNGAECCSIIASYDDGNHRDLLDGYVLQACRDSGYNGVVSHSGHLCGYCTATEAYGGNGPGYSCRAPVCGECRNY